MKCIFHKDMFKENCMLKKRLFGMITLIIGVMLVFSFSACENGNDDKEEESNPPETATYPLINLTATKWENADGSGEQCVSHIQIKLSDFTAIKPKQVDVLKFKISGNSSEQLKHCSISIFQMQGDDWSAFKWLGESSIAELPNPFNDYIFESTIMAAPVPNAVFYVQIANTLWQKNSSGEYQYDSGETLPPETENGDVMATISNFSISLIKDEEGDGGNEGTGSAQAAPSVTYMDIEDGGGEQTLWYLPGETLKIAGPTRSREGYTFSGWMDYQSGNLYKAGDTFVINKRIILHAIWTYDEE